MAEWPYNTARWQKLREAKLKADPACEYCPPVARRPATQVDHRKSIKQGGDPWAWSNLASACHGCHSTKTQVVDRGGAARMPARGCDAEGRPLDPQHWWNK